MKKIFIILFLIPFSILAQKIENSPYTIYGLGELINPTTVAYRGMGYTGVANVDRYHFNLVNPAALGNLGTTAFEVGANARYVNQNDGKISSTNWGGGFDYAGIAFPLKNPLNEIYEKKKPKYHIGMGFSLSKFSRVNYNVSSIDSTQAEIGKYSKNYQGNGGMYKASWASGINYKNLSFGLDLHYLFGSSTNTRSIAFIDDLNSFSTQYDQTYSIGGVGINTGLLYNLKLNEVKAKDNPSIPLKQFVFGLTFNSGSKISTSRDEFSFNRQAVFGSNEVTDTIANVVGVSGKGRIPSELGIGAMYQIGESSAFTIEYKRSAWSNYFNDGNGDKENELNNGSHFAIGGYFRPNFKSYTSIWKRSMFKYGFYLDKDPRVVQEKDINNMGVTFGIGIPFVFQRKISHTDISFDLGTRGTGTVIQEKYFKINFGFTFNDDEWFIKRKYN